MNFVKAILHVNNQIWLNQAYVVRQLYLEICCSCSYENSKLSMGYLMSFSEISMLGFRNSKGCEK